MTPEQREQFKQAVFRLEPLPADWPADFAIITAYDPDGQATSLERNLEADAALAAELRALDCWYLRIANVFFFTIYRKSRLLLRSNYRCGLTYTVRCLIGVC